MRSLILTTLSVSLLACGSGDPGSPGAPSVLGNYSGGWLFEYQLTPGIPFAIGCLGSVGITSQAGSSFSGSFTIESTDSCDPLSGTLNGTIGADAVVTFELGLPGSGGDPLEAYLGCTSLAEDTEFSGTLSADTIRASAFGLYDCGDPPVRLMLDLIFVGSR